MLTDRASTRLIVDDPGHLWVKEYGRVVAERSVWTVFAIDRRILRSLQMSVRDGCLEDARALVPEMVAATREEPGALTYEYFLGDDGASCHIYERYADSDAVMAHLGNFGENFADRFMACFEPRSCSVYGPASPEVRSALQAFGAAHLDTLGDPCQRYEHAPTPRSIARTLNVESAESGSCCR